MILTNSGACSMVLYPHLSPILQRYKNNPRILIGFSLEILENVQKHIQKIILVLEEGHINLLEAHLHSLHIPLYVYIEQNIDIYSYQVLLNLAKKNSLINIICFKK